MGDRKGQYCNNCRFHEVSTKIVPELKLDNSLPFDNWYYEDIKMKVLICTRYPKQDQVPEANWCGEWVKCEWKEMEAV